MVKTAAIQCVDFERIFRPVERADDKLTGNKLRRWSGAVEADGKKRFHIGLL